MSDGMGLPGRLSRSGLIMDTNIDATVQGLARKALHRVIETTEHLGEQGGGLLEAINGRLRICQAPSERNRKQVKSA
jgi:hypothetical protein